MAVTVIIPEGAIRQSDEELGLNEQGLRTWRVSFKGDYDTLRIKSIGYRQGQTFEKGSLRSFKLSRISGGYGMLTLALTPPEPASEGGGGSGTDGDNPVKDIWSVHAVRNDVSIMAYCSSGLNGPQRADVEAWQKEPDGSVAMLPGFTKSDGSIFVIGTDDAGVKATATNDLLTKILKGIDSVMRFYPMLTKTRTYAKPPETVYEHLAEIDVPVVGEADKTTGKLFKPGNLDVIIKGHTWVKCQDDVTLQADGKFVRTESWMGFAGESVDVNLYGSGEQRWEMPYCHSKHGGQ